MRHNITKQFKNNSNFAYSKIIAYPDHVKNQTFLPILCMFNRTPLYIWCIWFYRSLFTIANPHTQRRAIFISVHHWILHQSGRRRREQLNSGQCYTFLNINTKNVSSICATRYYWVNISYTLKHTCLVNWITRVIFVWNSLILRQNALYGLTKGVRLAHALSESDTIITPTNQNHKKTLIITGTSCHNKTSLHHQYNEIKDIDMTWGNRRPLDVAR